MQSITKGTLGSGYAVFKNKPFVMDCNNLFIIQNVVSGEIVDVECRSTLVGTVGVPELFTYSEAQKFLEQDSGFDNLEEWLIKPQQEIKQKGLRLERKNFCHWEYLPRQTLEHIYETL